jgi:hypothetical protein
MDDPRCAELETFLRGLAPRQELVRRWALMALYRACSTDNGWQQRTRTLIDGLKLDESGLAELMKEADRVAATLRAEIAET